MKKRKMISAMLALLMSVTAVSGMSVSGVRAQTNEEKYGVKMQQIALAWEWAKGVTSPIIGATKASHFDDAAGAFAVKLSEEDIAYLEEPYVPHRIVGAIDHNPEEGVKLLDVKK